MLSACGNFRTYTPQERSSRLQQGEILSYLKKVDGTKLSIAEAQAQIPASPERVWNIVTDYNAQEDLGPRTKMVQITKIEGDTVWVDLILDSPWPMRDAAFTLKVTHDRRDLQTNWTLEEGNIKDSYGSWNIDPDLKNPGQSIATYTLLYDDGSKMPRWLVDWVARRGVKKFMGIIRKEVGNPKYNRPVYSISRVITPKQAQKMEVGPQYSRPTEPLDQETLEILR